MRADAEGAVSARVDLGQHVGQEQVRNAAHDARCQRQVREPRPERDDIHVIGLGELERLGVGARSCLVPLATELVLGAVCKVHGRAAGVPRFIEVQSDARGRHRERSVLQRVAGRTVQRAPGLGEDRAFHDVADDGRSKSIRIGRERKHEVAIDQAGDDFQQLVFAERQHGREQVEADLIRQHRHGLQDGALVRGELGETRRNEPTQRARQRELDVGEAHLDNLVVGDGDGARGHECAR